MQHQLNDRSAQFARCSHHHVFTDKSVKKGYRGNGKSTDHIKGEGDRHFLIQIMPLQLRRSSAAGDVDDSPCPHKQDRLIENMGKCMGAGAVDGQFTPKSNTSHHEAHLADDMVSEKPSDIVFQNRIDHTVKCHDRTQPDQKFSSWKRTGQHINSTFGCKCGHENTPGDGPFRVGIREPRMQWGNRSIDQETDQN